MIDFVDLLGWLGAALTIVAYSMKTMLPLRLAAIASSCCFITYSGILQLWPMLVLDLILLPFNLWRLWQILRLRRGLREARNDPAANFAVLKAYSKPTDLAAGDMVFRRGDKPDHIYFVESGEVFLEEIGVTIGKGEIFGEISFFTDANERTATARCRTAVRVRSVDETTFLRLYFQDPSFAMTVMKTITRRLIDGMERHPEIYRDTTLSQVR